MLDDFLFVRAPKTSECKLGLSSFYELAAALGVPIKHEKTVYPTTIITFLGLEIEYIAMEVGLPKDKLFNIRQKLQNLHKRKRAKLENLLAQIDRPNKRYSKTVLL